MQFDSFLSCGFTGLISGKYRVSVGVRFSSAVIGATHTLTPAAISGASIKLQESVDGAVWYDISGATGNITADGAVLIQVTTKCGQIRPYLTMTAGQVTLTGENSNFIDIQRVGN